MTARVYFVRVSVDVEVDEPEDGNWEAFEALLEVPYWWGAYHNNGDLNSWVNRVELEGWTEA